MEKGKGKRKEKTRKGIGKEKGKGKKKERKKERRRERNGKEKGEERRGKEEERERKGRGKGLERERKGRGKGEERGKKGRVSHRPFLMPQIIVFVIVLLPFVNPVYISFFWKWLQSSKKDCSDHLPGTSLVQNLPRIRWRTIKTTNNEMNTPKTLNSCRTTGN